jgi:neuronal guanine nucleotide exchange factor
MQNARQKQCEYLLNTESETDRERWLSSIRPPACSNPDEKIYASWDCPQVLCRHNYQASQEDELSLQENDLVNVLKKMPDSWYFGERVKDGAQGWFPSSYVQLVLNDHVSFINKIKQF